MAITPMCICGVDPCVCEPRLKAMLTQQLHQNALNAYASALGAFGLTARQTMQQALRNNNIYGLSQAEMMMPSEPLENAGIKVEDLIGWRIWMLTPSEMLQSYSTGHLWQPGVPMEGNPGDHDSQGVWAFKSEVDAAAKLNANTRHVMGRVRLWGHVVEHRLGYRAQFARIVSLDAVHIANSFPWNRQNRVALFWLRHRYGLGNEKR